MKPSGGSALRFLTRAAVIGALYAALTIAFIPISFGSLQFRISEAMCVLPLFFPEAVPGLFVGCVLSNLFTPNIPVLDIILGSTATLAAALLTRSTASLSRVKRCIFAPLPAVILNGILVGLVITLSLTKTEGAFIQLYALNALSVAAGEAVVCYGLGVPLIAILEKIQSNVKKRSDLNE